MNPIHIAVLALGGQGGGVLVDWIVALAEEQGWTAQSTSVAGVAQRTGATIYYLELVPPDPQGRVPVLAQMPVPGDVDILIAAELMEAGRATQRGFVTPDRTTVIASTHRTFAVQEKMVPGNGVADGVEVLAQVRAAAKRLVAADMQTLAVSQGSVISASLFGALAGSGALPFGHEAFEAVVRAAGVGVEPSLRALRAAAEVAAREVVEQDLQAQDRHTQHQATAKATKATPADDVIAPASMVTAARALPERAASAHVQPLLNRIRAEFAPEAWAMLGEGLQRVIDYQDLRYGDEYLDRVASLAALDHGEASVGSEHALTREAAHWIAVAMAYDDVIRVADLKTRAQRFQRVRAEVKAQAHDVVAVEEFLHPRLEEVASLLPRALGQWLLNSKTAQRWLAPRFEHGRRVQTMGLGGYLQLRALAGLRRWRRISLRHHHEVAHLQQWLDEVQRLATQGDYALAVELLRCRRLVKGYSDTHARGTSRFDRLLGAAARVQQRPDGAERLAALRQLALKDHQPHAFDRAVAAL